MKIEGWTRTAILAIGAVAVIHFTELDPRLAAFIGVMGTAYVIHAIKGGKGRNR